MKTPIKRPIELKYEYMYQLKDGRKVIYIGQSLFGNKDLFVKPYAKIGSFYLPHWKRQIYRRLRKATRKELIWNE